MEVLCSRQLDSQKLQTKMRTTLWVRNHTQLLDPLPVRCLHLRRTCILGKELPHDGVLDCPLKFAVASEHSALYTSARAPVLISQEKSIGDFVIRIIHTNFEYPDHDGTQTAPITVACLGLRPSNSHSCGRNELVLPLQQGTTSKEHTDV
jgi:hypothetical protein